MLKGISPLVTTVLIILISMIAVTLAITLGSPVIQRAKESSVINEALQNMRLLDNMIREVASEGSGSLRASQLRVSGGEYKINQKTNSIEFTYKIKSGILQPGTFAKEDNVILASGVEAKASEYDLDNDGSNELVLENEIMRVGILKNGTAASEAGINTSRLIKVFNFKETGANVTINDSSIIIDDFSDSAYGTGYTELIRTGTHLAKAEAVAHVNTTNVVYDVVYTLQSGADFLIVKIQNAYYK